MSVTEKMRNQLKEAQAEEKTLRAAVVDGETKEAREAAQAALDKVIAKIAEINEIIAELDKPADETPAEDEIPVEGERTLSKIYEQRGAKTMDNEQAKVMEQRAKAFVESGKMVIENTEARSVFVSSGKLATPTKVSGINDGFNTVSSIVDMVKVEDCQGMGSNKVAYVKAPSEAATKGEGEAYNESDPEFGVIEIKPETITVLSYISKEATKQSPLAYEAKVRDIALNALRKKASAIITTAIIASKITKTLAITALNENTVRDIALSYGGDENVAGNAILQLNKSDLITLGKVRGSDKKAVYEIIPNGSNPNKGMIKEGGLIVEYVINSNLTAGTLVYGQAHNFELDLFSDYEIEVSKDYKFGNGLLAIRGDAQIGGDVVVNEGFVVATVGTTTGA